MNEKKIRLGIIGAGIFAEANHFPSLSLHFFDNIERAAICDTNIDRANRLAAKYGWSNTYADMNDMISNEKLDAVIVCVGGKYAPDVAIKVLERGLPVFLEKPSSTYLDGTLRIAETASRMNQIVQVGHQKRYSLAYQKAREIVSNKEKFGNIIQIESKHHGFTVFPTFYTCMLEWQCHNLDIVKSFAGDIVEIEAKSFRNTESTGALTAMLRFESGALGTLGWGTYGGPGQYCERVEILSDLGKGVIIENSKVVTFYDSSEEGGDIDTGHVWTSDWNPISKNQSHVFNGYVPEMLNFIDCVKNGKQPSPSINDEVKTMGNLTEIAEKAGIPVEWEPVGSAL